ncbi:hypothetical protein [Nonomuraea sp. GTA35]|uniref:hypothetical protein n=1 Tax=Nonomuraea sp. GTA35 TaxID=1676746 RepID=UPI0035C12E55
MTDIFTVSIDEVQDLTLRGRVHLINPDVPFVSQEVGFPLALLVDAWFHLANGYLRNESGPGGRGDRCPFSVERGKEIVTRMRLKDEFQVLYRLIHGGKVWVTESGYLLADDGKTELRPRRMAKDVYNLGRDPGPRGISPRFVMTESNPAEFYRRAAAVVTSYHVSPIHNVPDWSEVLAFNDTDASWEPGEREEFVGLEGPADLSEYRVRLLVRTRPFSEYPYVDITVAVSDAGYLEHMAGGMRWSTTHTGYGY